MGAQISFLDGPQASSSLEDMPGYFEPSPDYDQQAEVVSILEGASHATVTGGTFIAAGRDVMTTTVNNIAINVVDSETLKDIAILDWLSVINYRMLQMANLEMAVAGTWLWFLRSNLFIKWLTSSGGILWGTGMPGAGKTILASIVIDYLQKYAKAHGSKIAMAFAYCRYTEPVPVQQILAALVRQLLERYAFLYPLVKSIYDEHRREMTKPSKAQLLEVLSKISQVFDTLFCALDGLDEAAPDVQFDLLKALSSVKANFFITSRPLEPLHSALPEAQFFRIAATDEDIDLLIREKLQQSPGLGMLSSRQGYSPKQSQIVSKIKNAARGMFLHAALQVERLRHATSLRDALESLDGLSFTMNDMYSTTLERINAQPGAKPQLALQILTWLVYARRGLTIDDLRYALAIPLIYPLPPNEDIVDPLLLVENQVLLSVCCGLVVVDKDVYGTQSLRLVHFTAVDFLKRTISPARAHLLLGTTCIRRIISVDTGTSAYCFLQNDIWNSPKYPLLKYALDLWVDHGSHCVGADGVVMDCFLREVAHLFHRRCPIPGGYHDLIYLWTPLYTVIRRIPSILPPLLAMADSQMVQAMESQVNSLTKNFLDYSTPLTLAVANSDIQAILALLKIPYIDPNVVTRRGTALMIAAELGKVEAAKLLLADPRVDANILKTVPSSSGLKKKNMTALMLSVEHQEEEVAQLLLSFHGARADLASEDGTTALMLAAAAGSVAITRLLLGRADVDVNRANDDGWTALMFAVLNGHISAVKMILDHPSIEVNTTNLIGQTALTFAVEGNHRAIFWQLCDHPQNRLVPHANRMALHYSHHLLLPQQTRARANLLETRHRLSPVEIRMRLERLPDAS